MIPEITLYLPNISGQLKGVLKALADVDVNIQAFSIEVAGEYSTVRLICDKHKKAIEQFQKKAFSFSTEKVLGIELTHVSGELLRIAELLGEKDINIEYGYLTLLPKSDRAIVLLFVKENNAKKAEKLLKDNKFKSRNTISDKE